MNFYLIVYHRGTGAVEVREYPESERDRAARERFARELGERENPDVEVVLLSSESLQTVKKTHGRYFFMEDYKARTA